MEYFVLRTPTRPEVKPHILGMILVWNEEAQDFDEDRRRTDAHYFAGTGDQILTREELLASSVGRRALHDFETHDESQFQTDVDLEMEQARAADCRMLAENGVAEAKRLVDSGLPREDVRQFLLDHARRSAPVVPIGSKTPAIRESVERAGLLKELYPQLSRLSDDELGILHAAWSFSLSKQIQLKGRPESALWKSFTDASTALLQYDESRDVRGVLS